MGLKLMRSPQTTSRSSLQFLKSLLPDSVPLGPSSVIVEHIFAMTSLQRSCLNMESLIVSPPRITHRQVGRLRYRIVALKRILEGRGEKIVSFGRNKTGDALWAFRTSDCPDFEASHAHGFCPSITRASHPQLHLGIRYPNLID
ncbi:hypothetical protein Tco_0521139 [Tanacetum coccineum]